MLFQSLIVEDSISIKNLNDLPFPDGYVHTDGINEIVVTGEKIFENLLGLNSFSILLHIYKTLFSTTNKFHLFDF